MSTVSKAAVTILFALFPGSAPVFGAEVAGWVETVQIYPGGVALAAKLDTGARLTSLHCKCVRLFARNGEKWVSVKLEGADGRVVSFERKVVRTTAIKRHYGKPQQRFVIKLGVCLKHVYKRVEVNVVDRAGFEYPMLIGRNFLAGGFLIDSGITRTGGPNCSDVPESD
ncbi:MAG: ATP-dependent zinc protease [Gammaproteobacteria bacterium]